MLGKACIVTVLLLFKFSASHGVSDSDIQVCEAHASDDRKIECYRDLMLNPSCHVLKRDQLSCFRRSGLRTLLGGNGNASPKQESSENASDDFFGQPQRLCSALSQIGLETSGWEASSANEENEWRCVSGHASFGALGDNNLKSNVAYHVYGASPARANDVRIVIKINNPLERKQALGRLEAATRALFKETSEYLPIELVMALRQGTPVSIFTDFGTVDLIRIPGEIESYEIALTDTKIVPNQDPSQMGAAGDFESCKLVTARAAGYSAYQVSGNPVPLQGAGHKSYQLRGRGMDWFICKVYPNGKYKVEAAMDGKYPLEHIAEGSF